MIDIYIIMAYNEVYRYHVSKCSEVSCYCQFCESENVLIALSATVQKRIGVEKRRFEK